MSNDQMSSSRRSREKERIPRVPSRRRDEDDSQTLNASTILEQRGRNRSAAFVSVE